MSDNWKRFLQTAGASLENDDWIHHFGNPTAEWESAQNGTIVCPLMHLGLIDCVGEDAREFLHNQLTSDINHLQPGQAQHGAWCSAKGRMLASFVIWCIPEGYRLLLSKDLVSFINKRLQMFVLRSKVKVINQTENYPILGLSGDQQADALSILGASLPTAPMQLTNHASLTAIQLDAQRTLLIPERDTVESIWEQLASRATPASNRVWQWTDIQAGFPLITEATREEFVPQMADFEKLGGVSFHKGCYPGQEVVARTQYLGKVKRHLYRVRCESPLAAGDTLHSAGHPEGATGQIVLGTPSPSGGHEGLAVVQAQYAEDLHLGNPEGIHLSATPVNP